MFGREHPPHSVELPVGVEGISTKSSVQIPICTVCTIAGKTHRSSLLHQYRKLLLIYCGDADEKKIETCVVAVRNGYNLVEDHAAKTHLLYNTESQITHTLNLDCSRTVEDYDTDGFYDEPDKLIFNMPSHSPRTRR
ncbi:hypothetical protein RB195_000478 [Necator americanus]|uniref:Uncharacterized protein n=1 Tax=Necator americanus TaxID=51031 RepID=A0ABR1DA37_NECAM